MKAKAIYKAMFATHEALRRLGFEPADIYAAWAPAVIGGPPRPATQLRAQGKQFLVDYPRITKDLPATTTQFAAEYSAAAVEYMGLTQEAGEANYREHYDLEELTTLGALLVVKGFRIPHQATS